MTMKIPNISRDNIRVRKFKVKGESKIELWEYRNIKEKQRGGDNY